MNANARTGGRCRTLVVVALGAFWLGARPGPALAQSRASVHAEALRRADELYQADRADKFEEAAALYRQALTAAAGADRRRCFDRLLAIYVRVGRQDQAIHTGLEYEDWLRRGVDAARARELSLDLGGWYLALGHHAAAEPHLRRALADLGGAALPPARRVTALTYLARAAEKQGDRARAVRAWREVEMFARDRLDDPRKELDPALRIECARRSADSYRFQGRAEEAVSRLEQILPAFDRLRPPDPGSRRDTLRQLAGDLAASGRPADAEKRLREAMELHRRYAAEDRLTGVDLSCELADVLERQGRAGEMAALRKQAVEGYRAVLRDPNAGRPGVAGALSAFWKLQALFQRTCRYDLALRLSQDQAERWAGDLMGPLLHAEQGRLQVLLGDYPRSRALLAGAVAGLEKQSPPNLVVLPAALLNLGVAELATGGKARAEEVGRRCLALYREYRLADDLVLVETHNLLGTCAAQDGDYARAIGHFRAGTALCARLGAAADPQHSSLLLNIALLYKAQGDLEQSLACCRQARAVYERFASRDALGFAALDAASAALLAAQARPKELKEAAALAPEILRRCQRHGVRGGPLVLTARHCQALFHLYLGEVAEAEKAWREVAELHGPDSPLRPRTLNYLGLTREVQGRANEAAGLYREALRLQEKNPRAFPLTHFTTLWRLADLAERGGNRAEARTLLGRAVAVVEKARLRTHGGARQRAAFFAQFEPGFEQLVGWCVRDGDVAEAVAAVAAGRSRTLLDQLLLANVDPRQGLRGPEGDSLRRQEDELRRRVASLRGILQWTPAEELEGKQGSEVLKLMETAQRQYAEVYGEILNASPVYRALAAREFTAADLEKLRGRAFGPKKLLLVYHVGRSQSHLLLLGGDRARRPEAFALTVPANVAERVAPPRPFTLKEVMLRGRGISLIKRGGPQPDLPAPRPAAASVPLGQEVLRALVENYLEQVSDPDFRPTRGLRLRPRDPARPLPAQRPELLAEILFPPAARERIRAEAPDCLVVVPDGALHKLPFEALLWRAGEEPDYALNKLPPLAYAPSVTALALLAERRPAAPRGPRSLLTAADPAYPDRAGGGEASGVWGQLERLTHAAKESEDIGRKFAGNVLALRGDQVTKKAVVAALPGRHVVHIAAHGIAHQSFNNQFGALALTPGPAASQDDGFLYLHEIYRLPLDECELAVLSACCTNVGPQPPLEAGVTLAGGFLAAGARRVVASHWGVDDESTARLMTAFFKRVTDEVRDGRAVAYARALQQAREEVRRSPRYSAPYYWAPFVLIGPAD